jgi:hypothetical protein
MLILRGSSTPGVVNSKFHMVMSIGTSYPELNEILLLNLINVGSNTKLFTVLNTRINRKHLYLYAFIDCGYLMKYTGPGYQDQSFPNRGFTILL